MGSFWGLDNAGKEAQGWPREFGAWTSQQYKDWLARGNEQYSAGDSASRWYKDYNLNRVNNGVGTIADINAKGSMIMPGVDQYVTDKNARILIYCNNNFSGAEGAFPSKLPSASLNLPTYVALYDYGYRNVYELGALIDVEATAIAFAGRAAPIR